MSTIAVGSRIILKNILFATDLSECSNKALPYALSVARRHGAMTHAVYVVPPEPGVFYPSPPDLPMVDLQADEWIQKYAGTLENQLQEIPHQVAILRGNICNALEQIIRERAIDLLVVGTHGRTGVRKLVMGSVAENLIRRAPCPVLSIGPNVSGTPDGVAKFRRILVATDFTPESLSALPHAISFAEEDEAELMLLHVVSEPAAGIVDLESTTSFLQRRLRDLLPAEANFWCHTECLVEFGQQFACPSERILEVAQSRAADLIVLGVRPVHSDLGLFTHLSSATAQIITQAACPVLTVRG
jgi:nucleotide-binding universal stress UspA family protein